MAVPFSSARTPIATVAQEKRVFPAFLAKTERMAVTLVMYSSLSTSRPRCKLSSRWNLAAGERAEKAGAAAKAAEEGRREHEILVIAAPSQMKARVVRLGEMGSPVKMDRMENPGTFAFV